MKTTLRTCIPHVIDSGIWSLSDGSRPCAGGGRRQWITMMRCRHCCGTPWVWNQCRLYSDWWPDLRWHWRARRSFETKLCTRCLIGCSHELRLRHGWSLTRNCRWMGIVFVIRHGNIRPIMQFQRSSLHTARRIQLWEVAQRTQRNGTSRCRSNRDTRQVGSLNPDRIAVS